MEYPGPKDINFLNILFDDMRFGWIDKMFFPEPNCWGSDEFACWGVDEFVCWSVDEFACWGVG